MKRFYKEDQEWVPGKEVDLVFVDAVECPEGYTVNIFDLLPVGHPKSTKGAGQDQKLDELKKLEEEAAKLEAELAEAESESEESESEESESESEESESEAVKPKRRTKK